MRYFKIENDKLIKEVTTAGKNVHSDADISTWTMDIIVKMHNSLVAEADQVTRFADKQTAIKRLFDAWDKRSVPVSPRGKKPRVEKVERPGRPPKDLSGGIAVVAEKAATKTWHKGSERHKAFLLIEAGGEKGILLKDYVDQVGPAALALLGKMLEVGVVELRP